MEDDAIMDLYWQRSQEAVKETTEKYGRLILNIAKNLLNSDEDAYECQNDTLLALWNQIPPARPTHFGQYAAKIAKNQALMRYRLDHAKKRTAEMVAIDELLEILPAPSLEAQWSARETGRIIDEFLDYVDYKSRMAFIYRYWYGDSVKEIAKTLQISENAVSLKLSRTKKRLRKYLIKEGFHELEQR